MLSSSKWLWVLVASSFSAAQTFQNDWLFPQSPDDTTRVNIGQNVLIQWTSNLQSWFSANAPSVDVGKADLWVTSADQHQFRHLVAAGVNVKNNSRVIQWNVQIPSEELGQSTDWVLRFVQSGIIPLSTSNSIWSPRFVIHSSSSPTVSAATASATPTTLYPASPFSDGSAAPDSNNTLPGLTPPTMPDDNWPGISGGVIAGIVVGVIIGGLALIYSGWILVRCIRSPRQSSNHSEDPETALSKEKPSSPQQFRRTKHFPRFDEGLTSPAKPSMSEDESPPISRENTVTRKGVKMAVHYKKGLSQSSMPSQ